MVSVLFAFPETRLYQRLEREGRLLPIDVGESVYGKINFVPRMEHDALIEGHKRILETIYSPRSYYERVKTFLQEYDPGEKKGGKLELEHVKAFFKSLWFLGIRDSGRRYYWMLLAWSLFNCPRSFPVAARLAITRGFFRLDMREYITAPGSCVKDI